MILGLLTSGKMFYSSVELFCLLLGFKDGLGGGGRVGWGVGRGGGSQEVTGPSSSWQRSAPPPHRSPGPAGLGSPEVFRMEVLIKSSHRSALSSSSSPAPPLRKKRQINVCWVRSGVIRQVFSNSWTTCVNADSSLTFFTSCLFYTNCVCRLWATLAAAPSVIKHVFKHQNLCSAAVTFCSVTVSFPQKHIQVSSVSIKMF